ncbi:hypothetical protein BGZ61DRAFT_446618 [Ilyonectria robusta]|uniref:uncharacterized protein n=1 Tax=Ilyonectria robusta TaxID=1079257 RepID=UPI001E8D3A59|nr:uncharacterized protein BGZ61DRAFT_446618 [Ilyonectria robusta]KAH8729571.1 hypothetical protein BGZ61DRAFT_446618 [Ilyonectria robusta]
MEMVVMTSDLDIEGTLIWGLTIDSGSSSAQATPYCFLGSPFLLGRTAGSRMRRNRISLFPQSLPLVQHNSTKKYGAQSNLCRCICWGRDLHRVCHSRQAREVASGGRVGATFWPGPNEAFSNFGRRQRCAAVQMQRDGRRDMHVAGSCGWHVTNEAGGCGHGTWDWH